MTTDADAPIPASATLGEPFAYSPADPYAVPKKWRALRGARLAVPQVNAIMRDAYAHPVEAGDSIVPDYGGALERFEAGHEIVDGSWVERRETPAGAGEGEA